MLKQIKLPVFSLQLICTYLIHIQRILNARFTSALSTVFILINSLGALQFRSPKNDVLMTKCGQIYQNFYVLKPVCMAFGVAFGNLLPIKSGKGHLLERGCLLE